MDTLDAATLGQHAVKLGLVTPEQLAEAREEAGGRNAQVDELVRVLERKSYLTTFQSNKLRKGDTDGYLLGGYRLLYMISAGSFGRVFRADDPQTGRVVAVKVLRKRWSEKKENIELFQREGRMGLTLKHPNIVEILAVSQDPASRQYFIVMEFVEGDNLRKILQIRGKMGVPEALRILEDSVSGLAYAYSRGVTHRDMKLTNILVSTQGQAKLTDFGLAGVFAGMAKEEDDKVDRTVDYAGLEKATGVKPGDIRSDIYFLGCVFYEMLTGRPPLEPTKDKNARMQKRRFEDVKPMSPQEVQAPPSLFLLTETMMSLSPQRRYQTPSQLLDAVRACRRDVSGEAGKPGSAPRSVFVAETDERLQEAFREKLKGLGYRVLISIDPDRALDRFRQQPYDALVVDVRTTGEDGLRAFSAVMGEAQRQHIPCAGVAILAEDQADWAGRISAANPSAAVLVGTPKLKELHAKLQELLGATGGQQA